jgi:hypothetical protein
VSAQYSSGGSHGSGDLSIYPPAPTTFDSISFRNFPEINSLASKLLPPPVHLEAKNFAGKIRESGQRDGGAPVRIKLRTRISLQYSFNSESMVQQLPPKAETEVRRKTSRPGGPAERFAF